MLTMLIVAASIYIVGFPILFWAVGLADKQFKNWRLNKQLMGRGANKAQIMKNAPAPAMPKWRERLKFTRSDKRAFVLGAPKQGKEPITTNISRRLFYWILRGVGFIVALIGAFTGSIGTMFIFLGISLLFYIASLVYGYMSADKLLKTREQIYKKMFSIARTKLGQSSEYEANPQQVIRIVEWRDYIKPQKVEFDIPDTFGEEGAEAFMKLFNQNFGKETAWVPSDDPETGDPGWDFEKGLLTIHAVPPLPMKAPWDEHYVLGEGVAWSFFPIALGVENGLELPNPKTGQVENVLGFDLSGEQAKVAQQFGLKMSQAITTSPMALIAGGTGGGKSLSVDTMVRVIGHATPEGFSDEDNSRKKDNLP